MKIKQSLVGVGLGLALLLAACGGTNNPLGEASPPKPSESAPASAPVVVGSADFTESKILAEIYSQALKAKGVESSTKLGIGSREIYIKALQDQSISAVPEYTGNLLLLLRPERRRDNGYGGGEGSAGPAAERPQAPQQL